MHELINSSGVVTEEKHTEKKTTKNEDPEEWWTYKLQLDGGYKFLTVKSLEPIKGMEKGEVLVVAIGADTMQARLVAEE